MTGPFASTGRQIEAAAKLYMQQNGDTVAGKKIQLIVKDDTGVADVTKRLAQELIVNDKVGVIAGFGLTPLALAPRRWPPRRRCPKVVMAAATATITEASPYIVRTSFTLPQATVPMAEWAAKNGIKKVVTLVSDYGPGIDAEKAFTGAFTQGGGQVREPAGAARQSGFLALPAEGRRRQARCAVRVRSRRAVGAQFMKQFVERGLDKSGIKLIGHRRRHGRRSPQRHGRRGARRDHDAPLLGRSRQPGEQGVRRGLQEGQQRHAAELHGGRRL